MVGYWKPVYIKENDVIAMKGTEPYELPEVGDCTMLELILKVQNGLGHNYANNPEYSVSKVEVLHHGNHVMKSFDAQMALFSAFKDMPGVPMMQQYSMRTSEYQILRIPILFGRHFGDTKYYARWEDLGDCALRLTRDFTTGSEYKMGTDYLAASKVEVDLIGWKHFGEALPPPDGYLKSSLVKEWNPTTNNEKQDFKPSIGNKWRHIIMQAEAAAWWMSQKVLNAQFDENNESPIFWERTVTDWEVENALIDNLIAKTQHGIPEDVSGNLRHMIGGRDFPAYHMKMLLGIGSQPTEVAGIPANIGGSGVRATLRGQYEYTGYVEGVAYQECLLLNLERMFGGEFYESAGKSMPRLRLECPSTMVSTILPRVRVQLEELIEPPYTV